MTTILCMAPDIWCSTEFLLPLITSKIRILKKYTSTTKIMIICSTIPEIWRVTDVIFIFILGYFLPFYPPNNPKIKIQKKKLQKHLEISSFYTSIPKILITWRKVRSWEMVREKRVGRKSDIKRWVPLLKRDSSTGVFREIVNNSIL